MREKLRRGLGFVLIILGVIIIGAVCYRKIETNRKQKELQAVLQDVIKDDSSNDNKSTNVDNIDGFIPIALIEIPSINLKQGLIEGITEEALQYYLGHFENSVLPGEAGNFAVAGHRVSNYSDAFVNLYKAEIGDDIIVKSKGKEFVYKIEDSFVVSPDRVDVLDNTKEATITLVTCTLGGEERLIVKGNLVSTEDIKE